MTPCIISPCRKQKNGYAKKDVKIDGKWVSKYAHRLAWEEVHGPIPDGMNVCHTCDTPPCVNVEHLFLGTQKDNVADMASKGRHRNQLKTHCPQGHEYVLSNVYLYKNRRHCKACKTQPK